MSRTQGLAHREKGARDKMMERDKEVVEPVCERRVQKAAVLEGAQISREDGSGERGITGKRRSLLSLEFSPPLPLPFSGK